MKPDIQRFALPAAVVLACAVAPAAAAQSTVSSVYVTDMPTERVSYADLDVTSEPGLTALTGRINSAVHRVCLSANPEPADPWQRIYCRRTTRLEAWQQVADHRERGRTQAAVAPEIVLSARRSVEQ